MFCDACGQSFDATAKFCKQCGAPRPIADPAKAPPIRSAATAGASAKERMKMARIVVALACLVLAIIANSALHTNAVYASFIALAVFAVGWSVKSIKPQYKIAYAVLSLIVVISLNAIETRRHAILEAEYEKMRQAAEAAQRASALQARQQADLLFSLMTPEQHLAIVRKDFRQSANPTEIEEGTKHLLALKGTRLGNEGEAIQEHYESQKKQEEKAAAIEEQKEMAITLDGARQQYATTLQKSLYDQDVDADVEAIGPQHTTLRMKWVLATKMTVYKLTQTMPFDDMRQKGFRKFVLTDGWEHSWTWNLDKY